MRAGVLLSMSRSSIVNHAFGDPGPVKIRGRPHVRERDVNGEAVSAEVNHSGAARLAKVLDDGALGSSGAMKGRIAGSNRALADQELHAVLVTAGGTMQTARFWSSSGIRPRRRRGAQMPRVPPA